MHVVKIEKSRHSGRDKFDVGFIGQMSLFKDETGFMDPNEVVNKWLDQPAQRKDLE